MWRYVFLSRSSLQKRFLDDGVVHFDTSFSGSVAHLHCDSFLKRQLQDRGKAPGTSWKRYSMPRREAKERRKKRHRQRHSEGGTVTVCRCGSESVPGDVAFAGVMKQMGATVTWEPESITVTRDASQKLRGVDVDCSKIPDAAMTLAVAALFAEGPTTIWNVYSWRLNETERMKAIVAECTKLGATVKEFRDYCIIHPPKDGVINDNVVIETYDDHCMAMSFSLAAGGGVNLIIKDPGCMAKTFPTYFEMLEMESVATH
jgi:3-phosphoshikimate 1-carboxyvinyltransferase